MSKKTKTIAVLANWFLSGQRWHHLVRILLDRGHQVEVFSERGLRHVLSGVLTKRMRRESKSLLRLRARTLLSPKLVGERSAKLWNRKATRQLQSEFFRYDADVHFYCHVPPAEISRKPRFLVFDAVDDYHGTPWVDGDIVAAETRLAAAADLITPVSPVLFQRFARFRPGGVMLVPNGAHVSHFASVPGLRRARPNQGKVFGYMGALNYWFDNELIYQVLEALPEWRFHVVGGMVLPPGQRRWLHHPRVQYFGQIPFCDLPQFLSRIDVGVIPFQQVQIVKSTSPIKLYEYLAAGLPVVSTSMPDALDLCRVGFVQCADTASEFASLVALASSQGNSRQRQEFVTQFSWESRLEPVLQKCGL